MTSRKVRQITTPPAVRALSTLPRIDYSDAFIVETDPRQDRTAADWARTMLEDAPIARRGSLVAGWTGLGLKLGPPWSDQHVLGWTVRRNTPDVLLLGAGSRVGMPAELLFERRAGALLFATFIEQQNRVVRTMWAGVEPTHVVVVRQLLERAAAAAAPAVVSPRRRPAPAP